MAKSSPVVDTLVLTSSGSSSASFHHQFPRLKARAIRVFSTIEIVIGIVSICIQIMAVSYAVTDEPALGSLALDPSVSGYCLLAGVSLTAAGTLGILAIRKHTRSLLIAAVVMGALSIVASLMAFVLSGWISAYGAEYYYVFQVICGDCTIWFEVEIILTLIYIVSLINSIILTTLTSIGLCCSKPRKNNRQNITQSSDSSQIVFMLNDQHPLELTQQQQFTQSKMQEAPSPYQYYATQSQPKSQPIFLNTFEIQQSGKVLK